MNLEMKEFKRSKTAVAFSLILMLTIVLPLVAVLPSAQAVEIPTYLLMSVAPNPIGVGQTVYVNAFLSKPTPTAGMSGVGDHYEDLTIEITKPDGTKQTIGPLDADAVGGIWATFNPTQAGNHTFQAFYPGQTLKYGTTYNGSILKPSTSAVVTLAVQAQPIQNLVTPPLPTEYWSRPIYSTNYDWAQLGGNWFSLGVPSFADTGMYDATGNFQPYTTAPDTAHILWTKPTAFGGQVGAPFHADQESQYTSTSILIRHWEPIIIYGILYYDIYPTVDSVSKGWTAVDLRTGETLWTRTPGITGDERLRMGQVLKFHSMQEFGSFPMLWSVSRTGAVVFRLYDAMTGEYLGNITNVSGITGFLSRTAPFLMDYDNNEQGTILGHYTAGGNLTMWNSTQAMAYPRGFTGTVTITIRPPATVNFSAGIQWSVRIPTQLNGVNISPAMSIAARTPEVILLRSAPTVAPQTAAGYSVEAGFNTKTGQLLWGPINRTLPAYQDVALLAARDGFYITHNKDTNEAYGYSLTNGQQLWGPVKLTGNAWSSISRGADIAYGNVYIWDFGGYVTALDLQTGAIKWTFTPRSAGYDTPYGIYPLWHFGTHSICDGKLFLSESSMYTPPLYPGAQRLAIDCYTGELVWSVLSFSGRMAAAHADGMMVQWNSFDSQIYAFGKGQTAATVSAPNVAVPLGTSVLITGAVTDESLGTKDSDRKARFPNGVPAIADEFMSPWMEYVYMQQPMPTNATGVPVNIFVTGPDGATEQITTVTSDSSGLFYYQWKPTQTGAYKITAVFDGSESYYSSSATTAVAVDPAQSAVVPTSAPTQTPTAPSPTQTPVATVTPTPSPVPEPSSGLSSETLLIIAATAIIIAVVTVAFFLKRRQ